MFEPITIQNVQPNLSYTKSNTYQFKHVPNPTYTSTNKYQTNHPNQDHIQPLTNKVINKCLNENII